MYDQRLTCSLRPYKRSDSSWLLIFSSFIKRPRVQFWKKYRSFSDWCDSQNYWFWINKFVFNHFDYCYITYKTFILFTKIMTFDVILFVLILISIDFVFLKLIKIFRQKSYQLIFCVKLSFCCFYIKWRNILIKGFR